MHFADVLRAALGTEGLRMNGPPTPDMIIERFCTAGRKFTVRSLEENMVLIEGDAEALAALGSLLIAQARAGQTCGFQISPGGAGRAAFSLHSDLGLYIHRTPCEHDA
jgi:hypothetical protein